MQPGRVRITVVVGLLCAVATWALAATWPRDDTGVPAPPISFVGSGGRPTLVSPTDRLPVTTDVVTTSSTDPSGWGRSWVPASITFQLFDNDLAVVRDFRSGGYLLYADAAPTRVYRSTLGNEFRFAFTTSGVSADIPQVDANPSLGVYVARRVLPATVNRSVDGIVWSASTLPTPTGFGLSPSVRWVVASQGTTILAAVQDGADGAKISVCRSTDGAVSWTCAPSASFPGSGGLHFSNVPPLSSIPVQALASAGPGRWILVDRTSRVYRSTDDGVSWAFVTQLIPSVAGSFYWAVACPELETCIMATGGDPFGTVRLFRSVDGGVTWTEVTTAKPNVQINHWVVLGSGIVVGLSDPNTNKAWWSGNSGLSFTPLGDFVPNPGCLNGYWTSATDGRGSAVAANDCENPSAGRRVMVTRPVTAHDRRLVDDQGRVLRVRPDGSLDVNVLNPVTAVTANQGTALASLGTNRPWAMVPVQHVGTLSNQAVIGAPNTEVVISIPGASGELVWWHQIVASCDAAPTTTVDLTITGFSTVRWRYRGVGQTPVVINFVPAWTDGIAATGDHSVRLSPCGAGISGLLSVQASRF